MSTMFPVFGMLVNLVFQFGEGFGRRMSVWLKERPYQLVWAVGLMMVALGTCLQAVAALGGWSVGLYRVWYLCVVVLPIAFWGQGVVYLVTRRWLAHISMALLLAAAIGFIVVTTRAGFGFVQVLPGWSQSQLGVPASLKSLATGFSLFGFLTGIGGALLSIYRFGWNGGSRGRLLASILPALGIISLSISIRPSTLVELLLLRLAALTAVSVAIVLTNRNVVVSLLSPEMLKKRRLRMQGIIVGTVAAAILSAVALMPLAPVYMGIANAKFKSVYIQQVPADNNGVYLLTDQGVLQVYSWSIEPEDYPDDTAVLSAATLHRFVVVSKQFDDAVNYKLLSLQTGEFVPWQSFDQKGTELTLDPGSLPPGQYELTTPTDNMFGGDTYEFFTLQ